MELVDHFIVYLAAALIGSTAGAWLGIAAGHAILILTA